MEELQEKLEQMAHRVSFDEVTSEMSDIFHKKNSDYGGSFVESCREFGLTSPIIRMSDKLNRLKSLSKCNSSAKVKDEKIEDTLLDLANYAVMTILWLRNEN